MELNTNKILGAGITEYSVVSACGGSLYSPDSYEEEKGLEKKAFTDEELEVVEVFGQTALFTNSRVFKEELPNGIYKYDLREGEDILFATVEKNVTVNHGGTLLVKEPLDFGSKEYIVLDDDTTPNFLGYNMTLQELLNTDFTQEEDMKQSGGIQL